MSPADLEAFRRLGALRLAGVMGRQLTRLLDLPSSGPGKRLQSIGLGELITPATAAASALIGARTQPVRAVLFDKTPEHNWALGWHQDRTIVVRERREAAGFGPWSRKQGLPHVAPPFELLERMVTLRIHLDPCGPDSAPLVVALGSHRLGPVAAGRTAARAAALPQLVCLAEPGDVWAYATPILHASDRAARPTRRRVLQVDYSADELPSGLEWAGVEP